MKKSNALRKFWYNLPPNQRYKVRRLYYFPADLFDTITGKKNKYVPPRGYIYTGSSSNAKNYLEQGREQLDILKNELLLRPNDHVLDIGSGIGRTAIALTQYLNREGQYEGFDAVEKGVKWCNTKLKKDFPNFNFKYIPLNNDLYNNSGIDASKFDFPYKDRTFNKVFLFSVFTHMQINEIKNYLKEIERVLEPGGMCLATLFIYSSEIEKYICERDYFSFPVKKEGYRLMNNTVKSANVAISIDKLNEMILATGLKKVKLIDGFWKDAKRKKNKIEFQDILILKK